MQQNTLDTIYTLLAAVKSPQYDIHAEIKKLFPLLAQVDPHNYHKHYEQLVSLAQQIEHIAGRGELQHKTVIGVGGGFSAGKSRFINSFLSIDKLPEALEPCTAVATYVSWNSIERMQALNLFNHHVEINAEHLGQLRHFVGDEKSVNESIQLGQLLQHVHISSPAICWEHVAFLDTPGYSKAYGQHHVWSDYQTALMQLSEADYVIWLVSAKNGTIRNEDLEFLQAIELRKPLFIVVTQSDLVLRKEVEPIMQGIKNHLANKNIPLAGMMAWAAPISEINGKYIAGDDIVKWLNKINRPMAHGYQEQLSTFIKSTIQSGIIKAQDLSQESQNSTSKKLVSTLENAVHQPFQSQPVKQQAIKSTPSEIVTQSVKQQAIKSTPPENELDKGVWTDPSTGLMWARISIGQKWINGKCVSNAEWLDWHKASLICKKLRLAGYNDWRLPTIKELKTLMKANKTGYNCPDGMLFKPNDWGFYWSSSAFKKASRQGVDFDLGRISSYSSLMFDGRVRAVRGKQA